MLKFTHFYKFSKKGENLDTRKENLSLLCDFYEFTMANGYLKSDLSDKICYFDVYFRQMPDDGGFVIAAGLEQIIDFVQNLRFNDDDIEFFKNKKLFDSEFLAFLRNFKFSGDIYAVREGEIVFANEPILSVRARASEAQLLETFLLLSLNHQSLIATKSARIVLAAKGRAILEFGSRRAQGIDAALKGTRAAFIGGVAGSALTLADKIYGVSAAGTMAHSWVQMFESEFEAFCAYCRAYPKNAILLVDTYDAKKGIKNAIRAFKEILLPLKATNFGIRLDSGDLCELSKFARRELDNAGLKACKIVASGALDEFEIEKLLKNGAKIDTFGVGERLITAKSSPVLGCVYKLVAVLENGILTPKIKISESVDKISNPSHKRLYRFFKDKKAVFDELYLANETQPNSTNLSKNLNIKNSSKSHQNLVCKELLVPIFKNGKLVYKKPNLKEIRAYAKSQLDAFDKGILKLKKPKIYTLKLSQNLKKLKNELLKRAKS